MRQYEAVLKVMKDNGGFATLGYLNENVLKIKGCEWKTKTPFASIRRIVQDERYFFKIKPGLWALKSYKEKLPFDVFPIENLSAQKKIELNHSYYQGLLVEIGNIKKFETFIPYQDKNKDFLGNKLGEIASVDKFYEFTYEHIIKRAITIDVSWFNTRKMPNTFFEVEHSTDIQNSLIKYVELQDFNSKFYIVANNAREREYNHKVSQNVFSSIKGRVRFMSYEKLSEWHAKAYEMHIVENDLLD